jgi:lipopolysaccharide export system protein LptA
MRTSTIVLPFVLATLLAAAAHAEKADREKEIQVLADRLVADETKQEAVYEGNVVVTQGTLRITASRIVVREDREGYRTFIANGAPVTFRQKRDKLDDWIEGSALRAEFDDRSELLRLFSGAKLKSAQGELTGDFISYDRGKELFQVTGAAPGAVPSPEARVKATIVPQRKAETPGKDAPKPAEPVMLKPETSTGKTH